MRFRELIEARPWKLYRGRRHLVRLVRSDEVDSPEREVVECDVFFGSVFTGRTETFAAYYVHICDPAGELGGWLGEHPHLLYDALRRAAEAAQADGWTVLAIGRTPQFKETGLSQNSGFGIHPAYPDRHVHMSEPPPEKDKD